jgi:type IV pilus assembly protein PilE
MKRQRGVTLMELMTVVGVIGILSSIAYPAYVEQARRGKRASAKAMLAEVLQNQERFYSENNTFTVAMADMGYGGGPYVSENGTHTITLAAGPSGDIATSVSISATPVAADAKCGVLTLTSTQARTASGTEPAICW